MNQLLFIVLTTLVAAKASEWDTEKLKNVSAKCCPTEAVDCCLNVIQESVSLKCEKMSAGETLRAANCIQKELFPNVDSLKTFNIQDLACCDVFTRNDNDPNNRCYDHCKDSLMTVALKPSERINNVSSCQEGKTLINCFSKCVDFLHLKRYRKKFAFTDHCLMKDRMVEGKIYIGSNV